jgi:predicted transcriptional regulator
MSSTYHAPVFEPTVDEIETLKQLEMGERITMPDAMRGHLSERLYERGYITKSTGGQLQITDSGRQLIRRQ